MVGTSKVNHFKVKDFLSKVGGIPECDGVLDAPEGDSLDVGYDPKEGASIGVEAPPWDPHVV